MNTEDLCKSPLPHTQNEESNGFIREAYPCPGWTRYLSEHAQYVTFFYTKGRHILSILGFKSLGIPLGELNLCHQILAENKGKDTSLLLKVPALPG